MIAYDPRGLYRRPSLFSQAKGSLVRKPQNIKTTGQMVRHMTGSANLYPPLLRTYAIYYSTLTIIRCRPSTFSGHAFWDPRLLRKYPIIPIYTKVNLYL